MYQDAVVATLSLTRPKTNLLLMISTLIFFETTITNIITSLSNVSGEIFCYETVYK